MTAAQRQYERAVMALRIDTTRLERSLLTGFGGLPDGARPRLRIARTSTICGGPWAWVVDRTDDKGASIMLGCVCHHWWTGRVRA